MVVAWMTYYDLVRFGLEYLGSYDNATTESLRSVKRACESAIREILSEHDWSYLFQESKFTSSPPYFNGTVTYVASPRTLTLSAGTWPLWSANGVVQIADRWYEVESRVSGTELLLRIDQAPTDDIASPTTYTIYQETYDLPDNFSVLIDVVRWDGWSCLQRSSPRELFNNRNTWRSSGAPTDFTIYGSPHTPGRSAIRLFPVPDRAEDYAIFYKRQIRPFTILKETDGKVSLTLSDPIVVGMGTTWNDRHVGAILRVGRDANSFPGSFTDEIPNVFEARILSVTDDSHLVVDRAPPETVIGRSVCISDPLDIDQVVLASLVQRAICRRLAIDRKFDGPTRQLIDTDYGNELLRAKQADAKMRPTRVVGNFGTRTRRLVLGPNSFPP